MPPKKYPDLIERAFIDLAAIWQALDMPDQRETIEQYADRAFVHIDAYVDRPQEEKEALKTLLVLSFGSPAVFEAPERFAERYNPLIASMVVEILAANSHNANLEQAGLAHNCALLDLGKTDAHFALDRHTLEELRKMETDKPSTSAPRLRALYLQKLADALHDVPGQPAPRPPAVRPKP